MAHCCGKVFAGETLRLVPMEMHKSEDAQFP